MTFNIFVNGARVSCEQVGLDTHVVTISSQVAAYRVWAAAGTLELPHNRPTELLCNGAHQIIYRVPSNSYAVSEFKHLGGRVQSLAPLEPVSPVNKVGREIEQEEKNSEPWEKTMEKTAKKAFSCFLDMLFATPSLVCSLLF